MVLEYLHGSSELKCNFGVLSAIVISKQGLLKTGMVKVSMILITDKTFSSMNPDEKQELENPSLVNP